MKGTGFHTADLSMATHDISLLSREQMSFNLTTPRESREGRVSGITDEMRAAGSGEGGTSWRGEEQIALHERRTSVCEQCRCHREDAKREAEFQRKQAELMQQLETIKAEFQTLAEREYERRNTSQSSVENTEESMAGVTVVAGAQ